MSNYLPSVKCETPFEGDLVTYTVQPIENADFGRLLPFFKENDEGDQVIAFEDQAEFMQVAADLLGKYVSDFAGLTDGTGAPLGLDVVTQKSYFMSLISAMAGELFKASMTSEVEVKNSDAPSEQD